MKRVLITILVLCLFMAPLTATAGPPSVAVDAASGIGKYYDDSGWADPTCQFNSPPLPGYHYPGTAWLIDLFAGFMNYVVL